LVLAACAVVLLTFLARCAGEPMPEPANAPSFAIALSWEVLQNPVNEPLQARSRLTLANVGETPMPAADWAIYFNFGRLIDSAGVAGPLAVSHLNGDFYRLTPRAAFQPLAPGDSVAIDIPSQDWLIKHTDAPAGFYLVAGADITPIADVRIAPFIRPEQTTRFPGDLLAVPTAASRFAENALLTPLPLPTLPPVTPTPMRFERTGTTLTIGSDTRIHHALGLEREAAYLAGALGDLFITPPAVAPSEERGPGIVALVTSAVDAPASGAPDEAYRLTMSPEGGVVIEGATPAGVFYGIQSLRALLPPDASGDSVAVDAVNLLDAPRFGFRGMHVDVARHFHDARSIERLLEAMAFYKLNRLHLHLSDDEGWRLEIPGLPELTEIGGRRGHTLDESDRLYPSFGSGPAPDASAGSGFYSRAAFIDLLRFAAARHIEVIPEFDFPGHSRAAIVAMEARHRRLTTAGDPDAGAYRLRHPDDRSTYRSVQMWDDNVVDVCLPSTLAFVRHVIDETVALYREAGAPLTTFHAGGDEVPVGAWVGSPACQSQHASPDPEALKEAFFDTVYAMVAAHRLTMGGWEEIALHHGPAGKTPSEVLRGKRVRPNTWNTVWGWGDEDNAYRLANAGYEVVMSNASDLYFDLAYDKDPEEPGYYWAGFVDTYHAFAFTPLDLFKSARFDRMGAPLNPVALARGRTALTDEGRGRILGIQGQLWGENATSRDALEYLLFPKLLGLAERAWARAPAWETSTPFEGATHRAEAWNVFANQLGQRELSRLDRLAGGLAYRIPPPGVLLLDGLVHANAAFPGLTIHYASDGSEAGPDSPRYEAPLPVGGAHQFRTVDSRGRTSRAVYIDP